MPAADVRVRFAPSPTGYLHIGGARTALFNWLFARHTGGQMLLRIEDTDAERSQPELIDAIFRALDWLGIDFDGEPVHQSDRLAEHVAAAEQLLAEGRAYRCDCTQEAVKARNEQNGGPPGYDGFCRDRDVAPGPGVVVRFRTPDEGTTAFTDLIRGEVSFENANLEDFVIVRSSGLPMFLVANAVDDAAMGITHIVRGEDLINVTPKVLLLRQALGITDVPVFAHLPLIVNEQRKKLSKRRDDVSVGDYIERGYLPEAMVNYLATLGWGAPDGVEVRPLAEIVDLFRLEDVSASSAFFDLKKLAHFDGEYIRQLPLDDFVERCQPWLHGPDAPWADGAFDAAAFAALAPLVQERVKRLDEVPGYVEFLFVDPLEIDEDAWEKVMVKGHDRAVLVLDAAVDLLADVDWSPTAINDAVIGWIDANELSRSKDQAPIRVAVTGRTVGAPLWESLAALGRDRTLERLRAAARPSLTMIRLLKLGLKVLIGLVALLVLYVGVTFAQVWWASRQSPTHPHPSSAIVVMGAAQYNGQPSPVLKARLDHAADLYEQGVAPLIVVTGGKKPGDRVTQGRTGFDYLRDRGIPESAIKVEVEGTNSYEELSAAALIVRQAGADPEVVIVSDPYHSMRISQIAEQVGLTPHLSPDNTSSPFRSLARETAAVAVGRVVGYRRLANIF